MTGRRSRPPYRPSHKSDYALPRREIRVTSHLSHAGSNLPGCANPFNTLRYFLLVRSGASNRIATILPVLAEAPHGSELPTRVRFMLRSFEPAIPDRPSLRSSGRMNSIEP